MKQFFFNLWNNFQRIPTGGGKLKAINPWPDPPEEKIEVINPVVVGLIRSMVNDVAAWKENPVGKYVDINIFHLENTGLSVSVVGQKVNYFDKKLFNNCKYLAGIIVYGLSQELSRADKEYIAQKIEEYELGQIGALIREDRKRKEAEKYFAELSLTT